MTGALLKDCRVVICVGSGGVGKTTVSASLATQAAVAGKKVLVLTIDPAKRLAQTLGLHTCDHGEIKVPNQNFKGEIYAGIIRPDLAFEAFIRDESKDKKITERLLKNSLYKQLSTTLSGSQEFTSLDRLYRAVSSERYDLVILDTPPAEHAMEFLSAPEKIYTLFQKSITKWFMQGKEERGLVAKLVSKGTFTVLAALERVTGSDFIGDLSEFFECVEGLQEKISKRSIEVSKCWLQEN